MLSMVESRLQDRLADLKMLALHVGCVPRRLRQLGAHLHTDKQPAARLDHLLANPEEAAALVADVGGA